MTTKQLEHLPNIPACLREPSRWIHYYLKKNPKHPEKPSKAACMKWGTAEDRAANLKPLDEILKRECPGFQRWIDPEEDFIYIDLDHVRSVDTGDVEPWAQTILDEFSSTYTEISASGTGFHIVCKGKLPEDFVIAGNKTEIYSGHISKLLAMTGDVHELRMTVENCQVQAERLLQRLKGTTASEIPNTDKRKKLEAELDGLAERFDNDHAAGLPTDELSRQMAAVAQALKETIAKTEPKTWRDAFHTGSELGSTPGKVFIKGILEEGITYFGALSGTGKTWIGLSIAHALLSGKPLFGVFPVINKANVLYLVPEMGGNKFRERIVKMKIGMDGGFFCQTIKDGACDLEDPLLLQAVKDTQGVVILDTAIRFQHGDEQSSTEQAQGLGAKMFKLIAAGAPAIICMHHRSKDRKDKEPSLENTLRGTTDFGAQADCVWCVEHSRKKQQSKSKFDEDYEEESRQLTRLTLTCTKPRDMEPADPFTIQGRPYINENGDFVVLESDGGEDAAATKELSADDGKVQAMVEKVKANPKTTSRQLRKDTGFGLSRVKNTMAAGGWVQQDGIWINKSTEIFDSVEGEPLV